MKEKVSDLVRLHKAVQGKLKNNIIFRVNPNSYLINDLECTVQNILMSWTSHEIKKVGGILAKPAPKKEKTITTETVHLVTKVTNEDGNFSR